jgi:hypothetical protein
MQNYDSRSSGRGPSSQAEGGDPSYSLANESLPLGLMMRDARRIGELQKRGVKQITVAPCLPHSLILLRDRETLVTHLQAIIRSATAKAPRSEPPRICYRLSSLGVSYSDRQRAEPFAVESAANSTTTIIKPPDSLADSIQQILVADKRVRIVREIATPIRSGCWLLGAAVQSYSRDACIVAAMHAGASWYLPLTRVLVTQGSGRGDIGDSGGAR